jgi:membrane protease YdiL (CAAX protease family)
MNFHTHYLEIIILACMLCFPSAFIFFGNSIKINKISVAGKNALMTCIIYSILSGIVYGLGYLKNVHAKVSWLLIVGCLSGIMVVFGELLMAQIKVKKKSGKFTRNIKPPSSYVEKFSVFNLLLIILAAGLEELVFRQIFIRELFYQFENYGIILGLGISTLFYALNHIYFGRFSIVQKIVSGLVFGLLFIISSFNILIPVIAHCTQNVSLYIFGIITFRKERK